MPTCKGSILDFFVVDRRLLHAVKYVKRLDGFGISPHSPVRLALWAGPRRMMIRCLVAPRRVPAVLPAGCMTECQAVRGVGEGEADEAFEQRFSRWMGLVEGIWADIMGMEGEERERVVGRSRGPRLVWKSALGPPSDKALYSTKVSRSWARIVEWCGIMRQARRHEGARADRHHPMARVAAVAARRIQAAKKWKWSTGEEIGTLHKFIEAFGKVSDGNCLSGLSELIEWAEAEATNEAQLAATDAAKRYRERIHAGQASGQSRQHSTSKCLASGYQEKW